jgi:hypothetical protein
MLDALATMMRKTACGVTLALLCCAVAAAACSSKPEADPKEGDPIEGRASTGTGVSLDFGDGWIDAAGGVTPFTKVFRNRERQLEVRCVETSANGLAVTTHGDQMKRGLSHDGTVVESGPLTVDGRPAYRAVVQIKTPTGHGLVVGTTILKEGDRISTLYVATAGDERPEHRAAIDALLATLRVE